MRKMQHLGKLDEDNIGMGVVYAQECEYGPVYYEEMRPFIVLCAEKGELSTIMPAPNWKWVD